MCKALFISLLSMLACWAWGQSYSYRYWIDDNVGSATSGSATGETQFTINTAQLASGVHAIHVQAKGSGSDWSSVQTRYFLAQKATAMTTASARYWIDDDLTTMHDGVATSGTIDLDISGLKTGIHCVHYQKIATDGTPSSAQTRYFLLYSPNGMAATSARYWIDNDLATMHNGVATSGVINIDITGLGIGLHSVHYQKIAADGTPSAAQTRYFYVDRVQGGGYKAAISIDGGEATLYDVDGEEIVIDLGDLQGSHQMHVVIYDDQQHVLDEQTKTFTIIDYIRFAENTVKEVCVAHWDTNADGVLSYEEAAAVTTLGTAFKGTGITTFDELKYFTGLKAVSESAFEGCTSLKIDSLPAIITSIGSRAFYGCSSLTKMVIPAAATEIGADAFGGCTHLTTVKALSKTPVAITENTFSNRANAVLYVPRGSKAAYAAATGWKDFKQIVEIKTAAEAANDDKKEALDAEIAALQAALDAVVIGKGEVMKADSTALVAQKQTIQQAINTLKAEVERQAAAVSLTAKSTLPDNTVAADIDALKQALQAAKNKKAQKEANDAKQAELEAQIAELLASLNAVTMPDEDEVLPEALTQLTSQQQAIRNQISAMATYVAEQAEANKLTAESTLPANTVAADISSLEQAIIAAKADKEAHHVVEIIQFADSKTKNVCLQYWDANGDGDLDTDEAAAVTDIGTAFQQTDITSFDELRYFTGLTGLPSMAFALCQQLKSITIPKGVTTVGGGLFYYCDALTSIQVVKTNRVLHSPDGINAIIDKTTNTLLAGCTTTVIPDNVTAIGEMAFYHVHGHTSLTLPQGLKSIGMGGLFGMMEVESLTIPKSVTSIGLEALGNMNALVNLVVEQGNTVYDSRGGCNAVIETATNKLVAGCLKTVIPNTVEAIGKCAFDVCPITSLHIPASVKAIDEMAVRLCGSLAEITVDAGNTVYNSRSNCNAIIETATNKLLLGCLTTVIPAGTRSIGNYAFYGYERLTEIRIPASVTAIGDHAFDGCEALTSVTVGMRKPMTIAETTFTSRFEATLYVPKGCRSLYMAAEYWKDFYGIQEVEMPDEVVPTDIAQLDNAIYATITSAPKGGTATMTINMKNKQATSAYNFELLLPAGVTIATDAGGDYQYTLSSRHNGHSATVNRQASTGVYSFAVLSIQSKEVAGNDGAVLTLKLNIADNVAVGDYAVKIQNAKYSLTSGSTSVTLPDVISLLTIESYKRGDANGDGTVDIADAVCIVNRVVGKDTPSYVAAAADANSDGVVDIADAVRIVNLVVGKIDALAPRFEVNLPEPQ